MNVYGFEASFQVTGEFDPAQLAGKLDQVFSSMNSDSRVYSADFVSTGADQFDALVGFQVPDDDSPDALGDLLVQKLADAIRQAGINVAPVDGSKNGATAPAMREFARV